MKKICFVTTTPLIVDFFLRGHLAALSRRYDVTLVVNADHPSLLGESGIPVTVVPAPIERQISIFRDLIALARLTVLFVSRRYASVHSVGPKAGLLSMLAGWIARVPVRIHIFTGQVWVARRGFARWFLKLMDRLIAGCATHVLVDSPTQREFLIEEGVLKDANSRVLADGSINGVDMARFRPDPDARAQIRRQLGIGEKDFLILFLGRLTVDKGVLELAAAFSRLAPARTGAHLVLAGPDENGLRGKVEELCAGCCGRVHFTGFTGTPERFLAAADVLCLPSHREGFGNVIIEAGSVGIPAVASRIYGITDAAVENETALLHDPGDIDAIAALLERLMADEELRRRLGGNARQRVEKMYSSQRLLDATLEFYEEVLGEKSAFPG